MLALSVVMGRPILGSMAFLCAIIALATGGVGEIQSHGWYLDGRGRLPARLGMAFGALALLLSMGRDVQKLIE